MKLADTSGKTLVEYKDEGNDEKNGNCGVLCRAHAGRAG